MTQENDNPRDAGLGPDWRRRLIRVWPWLATTLFATLFALALSRTTLFPFDGWIYDQGVVASQTTPPEEIVILGLTEQFTDGRHVQLLPRDKLARLIDIAAAGRPAVIAVDWWLDSWVDGPKQRDGVDAQLKNALQRARQNGVRVLLVQVAREELTDNAIEAGNQNQSAKNERGSLTAHGTTLPYFLAAAAGSGGVYFAPAPDGIVRTLPRSTAAQPSLALLAVQTYLKAQGQPLRPALEQRLQHESGYFDPALGPGTPLDFCGAPGALQITPADDLLQQPALALLLGGKMVWIGATFPRSGDFLPSPYDLKIEEDTPPRNSPASTLNTESSHGEARRLYGVEILAQASATILRGASRHSPGAPAAQRGEFGRVLLVSALVAAAAWWSVPAGVIAFLLATALACVLSFLSARTPHAPALQVLYAGYFWRAAPPIFAAASAFVMATAWRQVRLARELRLVKEAFFGYVGDEVYQQLRGRPPELGGQTWDIAVLFCDIEGFSALAEGLRDDPARLLQILNAHFQPLVEALKQHGAFVDNYVGDLVMAIFGAPVSAGTLRADTRNAVRAALDFTRIIEERNRMRQESGEPLIQVGIGVHCGTAVVGNLGSHQKMHYTAIGDAVNIASRVESATRKFATPILVTEEVMNACNESAPETDKDRADFVTWNFMAETQVKGRAEPVRLYAPQHLPTSGADVKI